MLPIASSQPTERRVMSPNGGGGLQQIGMVERNPWAEPDMGVLRLHRRPPPRLPIEVFDRWGGWIMQVAEAAACPPDYVAAPLLPYRVDRVRHPEPIEIPRLAVAVFGGTQPDKLALLMREADDGLLGRMLWSWPEPLPFHLGQVAPGAPWAIAALDRLRELDLKPGDPPQPIMVPMTHEARGMIEEFGREMQDRQSSAGGLLRSALGKARGTALRLSLGLGFLWWCGEDGMAPPPSEISAREFAAAALLVGDYFMPMAERVYGDAAATREDRNAATIARWIMRVRPTEVYVRHLQREERLPGLKSADDIHAAAEVLIEADWLSPPAKGTEFGRRGGTDRRRRRPRRAGNLQRIGGSPNDNWKSVLADQGPRSAF
jgi:hypothetical protein